MKHKTKEIEPIFFLRKYEEMAMDKGYWVHLTFLICT